MASSNDVQPNALVRLTSRKISSASGVNGTISLAFSLNSIRKNSSAALV